MPKSVRHRSSSAEAKARRRGNDVGGGRRSPAQADFPWEAPFRALLDSLDVGVAYSTAGGKILYANVRFIDILAPSAFDIAGANLKRFITAASWTALEAALSEGTRHETEGEIKVVSYDKEKPRTVRLSFKPLYAGEQPAIRIVAAEVTELVETAEALKESEASLHSVSARLLRVQDEERRRLARDLHDTTGQELAVVILTLEHATRDFPPAAAKARASVLECTDRLRKVESEVRTLSYVLHPPLLEEMGLSSALQWYVDGFSKRTGIQVSVEVPPQMPRLHTERETALFRVIQESLTNVFRHSGSKRARVRLSADNSVLRATISDDGKGFDSAAVANGGKSGVGIQSMKGRLDLLGGTLGIDSKPTGTCVTATVPLYAEGEARAAMSLASSNAASGQQQPKAPASRLRKRILIADDHEVARRGIKTLLNDQPDLEICGEAEDGVAAVMKTRELQPDLVILDLSMPNLGGLSAAHQIRNAGMHTKILIYTTHSYTELEKAARAAGCDGFVTKSKASHDLIRAARTVLRGEKFYSELSQAQSA